MELTESPVARPIRRRTRRDPNPRFLQDLTKQLDAVAGCPQRNKRWVLAVTILASTISYIDESVVNVALPTIEADLKTSAAAGLENA